MIKLINFSTYTPEYSDLLPKGIYYQSEEGLDWYYHRQRFSDKTVKIGINEIGEIRCITDDVLKMVPIDGATILEVDPKDIPEGLDDLGNWVWDGEKIVPKVFSAAEWSQWAEKKRSQLLTEVSIKIGPLQDAIDQQLATDDEIDALEELKKYRLALGRLDISKAPDLSWPELTS